MEGSRGGARCPVACPVRGVAVLWEGVSYRAGFHVGAEGSCLLVLCGGGAGMCGVCGVSEGQWRCKHTSALLLVKVDEPTVRLTLLDA